MRPALLAAQHLGRPARPGTGRSRRCSAPAGSPRSGAGAAGPPRPRRPARRIFSYSASRSAGTPGGGVGPGPAASRSASSSSAASAASRRGGDAGELGLEPLAARPRGSPTRAWAASSRSMTSSSTSSSTDWRWASESSSCWSACRSFGRALAGVEPGLVARRRAGAPARRPPRPWPARAGDVDGDRAGRDEVVGDELGRPLDPLDLGVLGQRPTAVRDLRQPRVVRLDVEQPPLVLGRRGHHGAYLRTSAPVPDAPWAPAPARRNPTRWTRRDGPERPARLSGRHRPGSAPGSSRGRWTACDTCTSTGVPAASRRPRAGWRRRRARATRSPSARRRPGRARPRRPPRAASLTGWWRRSAVTKTSAPLARTASSRASPAPPQTATRETSAVGSPAIRTPCAVAGSASATSMANSRSVVGAASRPTRPIPRGLDHAAIS